jgi:hypothetical protein
MEAAIFLENFFTENQSIVKEQQKFLMIFLVTK